MPTEIAIEDGDLPKNTAPRQIAFKLDAIARGTNQAIQLRNEPHAADRGRRAMRRALGLGTFVQASRESTA